MNNITSKSLSENLSFIGKKSEIVQQKKEITNYLTIDKAESMIDVGNAKVLEKTKDEISKQVQIDKASLITVFGLFASILSFLTIEFQFLKTLDNIFHILGFSCMLWALLVSFNLGLSFLISDTLENQQSKPKRWLMIICCLLMIIGIIFVAYAGNPKINKP